MKILLVIGKALSLVQLHQRSDKKWNDTYRHVFLIQLIYLSNSTLASNFCDIILLQKDAVFDQKRTSMCAGVSSTHSTQSKCAASLCDKWLLREF